MRVAVAGTNGLAEWIAYYLSAQQYHQFVILSRWPKPHLAARGWTVLVVDYTGEADLVYHLGGVDLVISMVTGYDQLLFIDAALKAGVRKFVPAEFSGLPNKRPPALDQKHSMALSRLRGHVEEGMTFTTISCGLLYERFGPGGLQGANMGHVSGNNTEGDFLMDVRTMRAQIPHDASGAPAKVCITSMQDAARFIVAALNLPDWPSALRMRGQRMNVSDLVRIAERFRNRAFERADHNAVSLQHSLQLAELNGDVVQQRRVQTLMATGDGAFDFADANLNNMVNITPMTFEGWLEVAWAGHI